VISNNTKTMGKISNLLQKLTIKVPEGHKLFQGEYHDGDATYVYIPDGKKHIFDGSFELVYDLGGGCYKKAKGNYRDNVKEDYWHYERQGRSSVKTVDADFRTGFVQGSLECYSSERGVGESVINNELKMLVFENTIKGKILGFIDGWEVYGFCDDEGYADGKWTMTQEDKEDREVTTRVEEWEHGRLIKSYEERRRKKLTIEKATDIRKRVNTFLESTVGQFLAFVPRGNRATQVFVMRKE